MEKVFLLRLFPGHLLHLEAPDVLLLLLRDEGGETDSADPEVSAVFLLPMLDELVKLLLHSRKGLVDFVSFLFLFEQSGSTGMHQPGRVFGPSFQFHELTPYFLAFFDLDEELPVELLVLLHPVELSLVLLEELLGELDAVKSLEGVLLIVRVKTTVPDIIQFVPQIDNELLDVRFLQFLQSINFELELRQDRFTVALDRNRKISWVFGCGP